jgi:L,D-transpeptidase YcbB
MNVVVGAPQHETPELSSTIDSIVLNPTWTIPRSIIENEIKPLLRRNRHYLTQNRMYWSGDQLVQEPGPHNALGRIKFDFPNRYSVYLHDTPSRKLFTDPERAASHGCVRLERPLDLAVELLAGSSTWDREAIEQAIRRGDTRRVGLENPMPVVITYLTAYVDENGLVNFRNDVYGRDTALTLRLAERAGRLKTEPAQW